MKEKLDKRIEQLNFIELMMAKQIINLIVRTHPDTEPEKSSWNVEFNQLKLVQGFFDVIPNLPLEEIGQPRISVAMVPPVQDCEYVEFEYKFVAANDIYSRLKLDEVGNKRVKISVGSIFEIISQ